MAASVWQWFSRPRVRLAVIGTALLLTGGLVMTNSVWTLPLVAVGAAMIVTAWIGHRLDGRFAIEWGEGGTELAVRAKLKTPQPEQTTPSPTSSTANLAVRTTELLPKGAEIIDGEAHTVEIEVEELKALIAAAETTTDGSSPVGPSPRAADDVRVLDNRARDSHNTR